MRTVNLMPFNLRAALMLIPDDNGRSSFTPNQKSSLGPTENCWKLLNANQRLMLNALGNQR